MNFIRLKEIGIIAGYVTLLLGIIFLEWKPFSLFLSFIVEYYVILLVYAFLWLHRGVSKRTDELSLFSVLGMGIVFGLLQGGLLMLLARQFESGSDWRNDQLNLEWTIVALAIPMLIFHFAPTFSRLKKPDIMDESRSLVFTAAIAFFGTNVGGLIAYTAFKDNSPTMALVVMVILRIIFELWMHRYQADTKKLS